MRVDATSFPLETKRLRRDLDMRCHLLQHGIPNMDRLAPEDATILTRWVTFAHVPVKDTNSTVKLEDMQELTTKQALKLLQKLKFVHNASDGSLRRGDNETFASLEEARVYIRASASLAPPIQGRRARGTKFEISLESRASAQIARVGSLVSYASPDVSSFRRRAHGARGCNDSCSGKWYFYQYYREGNGGKWCCSHGTRARRECWQRCCIEIEYE